MQTSRDQLNIEVSPQQVSPYIMPRPIVEQPRTNENGAGYNGAKLQAAAFVYYIAKKTKHFTVLDNQVYKASSNSFASIDYLKTLDQLLIRQDRAALKDCDTVNQFQVKDHLNQQLFQAIEESERCARFCLATDRRFTLRIFDNFRNEVIRLERPIPWCVDGLEVYSPPGTLIGKVRRVICSSDSTQFVIKDAIGNIVFEIKYSTRKLYCDCSSPDELLFRIETEDETEVGNIVNLHPPSKGPIPDDSDKYKIAFPLGMDVTRKILILGSCFLMDAIFFEPNKVKWATTLLVVQMNS